MEVLKISLGFDNNSYMVIVVLYKARRRANIDDPKFVRFGKDIVTLRHFEQGSRMSALSRKPTRELRIEAELRCANEKLVLSTNQALESHLTLMGLVLFGSFY